jgi:RNA polymerase sigma-70 factor (ECF subfamily)
MSGAGVCLVAEPERLLDDAGFSRCCEELRPGALRFAGGMLAGDRSRAEELVQEALLRLVAARGRYQRDAESVRRYSYRILANLCLDELRRRRCGAEAAETAGELAAARAERAESAPDAEAARQERRRAVAGAVERLPERERAALLLRELGGRSYAEIAEALDTSVSDVTNLIHRARGRFAKLMRPWME